MKIKNSGAENCNKQVGQFRTDAVSSFPGSMSNIGNARSRQLGRGRVQQLQQVRQANREITEYLSTTRFTCRSMCRGIDKGLLTLRKTRNSRDE